MPTELPGLGVAGICVIIVGYILKLIVIDGRLHTDGEVEALESRIAGDVKIRDERIDELLKQVGTLTSALESSNDQSKAIISLWTTLQSNDRGD